MPIIPLYSDEKQATSWLCGCEYCIVLCIPHTLQGGGKPFHARVHSFRFIEFCKRWKCSKLVTVTKFVIFPEIRNTFSMKFSKILYERNSGVNPIVVTPQLKVQACLKYLPHLGPLENWKSKEFKFYCLTWERMEKSVWFGFYRRYRHFYRLC